MIADCQLPPKRGESSTTGLDRTIKVLADLDDLRQEIVVQLIRNEPLSQTK
jgi:hypothetical protein